MMELIYLWVEEYKNIKRQGFNFSPRFHCDYDPDTNELTIDENDDYIENFFGDNINVTAIVGKNGSGKSSIKEMILPVIPHKEHSNYIIVGFSKHNQKYHSWGTIKDFKLQGIEKISIMDIDFVSKCVEVCSTKRSYNHNFVYINGSRFDFRTFKEYEYSDADNNIFIPKYIIQYRNNYEIFKNKTFFYKFDKIRFILKDFQFQEIKEDIEYFIDETKRVSNPDTESFYPIADVLESIEWKQSENKFCDIFKRALLRYWLIQVNEGMKFDIKHEDKILGIENCFELTSEELSFVPKAVEIVEALNILKSLEMKEKMNLINNEKYYFFEMDIDNKDIEKLYIFQKILNFPRFLGTKKDNIPIFDLDLYDSEKDMNYNLLSNGEKQYIRTLIEVISNRSGGDLSAFSEPLLYFFDEIETSLHPEWQKRIFYDIYNIFQFWEKDVHLIFLTHSPFLLSDIPKQNIIFLDTDENGNCKVVDGLNDKKETFGANIHTLLSDSFFMEDGLMGEFAKGKIDEVIKLLNKEHLEPKELKYCEQIISIIGEPIIKNQLQKMLDSKRLKKIDKIDEIEKNIQALQEELEKLKNEKS